MQPALPPRMLDIREPAAAVASAAAEPLVLAQLGAWRTRGKAEEVLRAAHAADPSPPPIRVTSAQVRGRLWWRVVAGPMRRDEAQALCTRLATGGPCWVRPLGAE